MAITKTENIELVLHVGESDLRQALELFPERPIQEFRDGHCILTYPHLKMVALASLAEKKIPFVAYFQGMGTAFDGAGESATVNMLNGKPAVTLVNGEPDKEELETAKRFEAIKGELFSRWKKESGPKIYIWQMPSKMIMALAQNIAEARGVVTRKYGEEIDYKTTHEDPIILHCPDAIIISGDEITWHSEFYPG